MKITEYVPGTPCWVDLGSPDLEKSVAFYTALFGWTAHVSPDQADGGYTMFHLGDTPVAGLAPLMSGAAPPAWSWYAATDDAQATAARVEGAGGKVLMAPFDVPGAGRMAVFLDNTGAPFSVWQGGEFKGAQLVNEPNSFTWNELMTRDQDSAVDFYGRVLGWTAKVDQIPDMPYTEFQLGGRSIAGSMPMTGDRWPADLPSHWMVYFAVADVEATVARIPELGGTISVPPTDTPVGRFAVAGDPDGAWFSVITMPG